MELYRASEDYLEAMLMMKENTAISALWTWPASSMSPSLPSATPPKDCARAVISLWMMTDLLP